MAYSSGHVHIPLPHDIRVTARFGWVGEYMAINAPGAPLALYRCPGIESGGSDPNFYCVEMPLKVPCQDFAFPPPVRGFGYTKGMVALTDEGELQRCFLSYNYPPALTGSMPAPEGLCVAYCQKDNIVAVGCRGGLVRLYTIDPTGVFRARMVQQVGNSDVLQLAFTKDDIIVAVCANQRAYAVAGIQVKNWKFDARKATVSRLDQEDLGLPADFEVYTIDAQPNGHQVLFSGSGEKAYLLKLGTHDPSNEDEPQVTSVHVQAARTVFTGLKRYIRYAHFLSNHTIAVADRNRLDIFRQDTNGELVRIDSYDFSADDHTVVACRAKDSQRLYIVTSPFKSEIALEV